MIKIWIVVLVAVAFGVGKAQSDHAADYYDFANDYSEEQFIDEAALDEDDKKVYQEIETFRQKLKSGEAPDPDDYQFEDNRSEIKDVSQDDPEKIEIVLHDANDQIDSASNDAFEDENPVPLVDEETNVEQPENEENFSESDEDEPEDLILEDLVEDKKDDSDLEEAFEFFKDPAKAVDDAVEKPDQDTSNQEDIKEDKENEEDIAFQFDSLLDDIDGVNQQIFEETKAILNEKDEDDMALPNVEEKIDGGEIVEIVDEKENVETLDSSMESNESIETVLSDDDSVDKVYADLNEDLNRLFETWEKLKIDDSNDDENDAESEEIQLSDDNIQDENTDLVDKDAQSESSEDTQNQDVEADVVENDEQNDESNDNVLQYESKYGKPFREDLVLSQRDFNYDELVQDNADNSQEDDDKEEKDEEDSFELINDSNLSKIFELDLTKLDNDYNDDDIFDDQTVVKYDDDGLVADKAPTNSDDDVESKSADTEDAEEDEKDVIENSNISKEDTKVTKVINVDELTSADYDQLMKQFNLRSDDLSPRNDDVVPIHIKLSVDEPTVITSPDYPSNYPTNNVVDWYLDGEGRGIELNITDFTVNGVIGDYLLVIPGGVDASNTDGLIFSYTLAEGRKYRFNDVNKLYMRFKTHVAMAFNRGFSLSVKMISPVQDNENEDLPDPEALLPYPEDKMVMNLGGINITSFLAVQEEFRLLLADMATLYINANEIDTGRNTTAEVTQITSIAICNVHWPNMELCTEVTFGIPLVYDEDQEPRLSETDLRAMWYTYSVQDPFVSRLLRMGITEFIVPNDSSVMMLWVVIGVGVLVAFTLLAFTMWRYSCLQNYTRMPSFSDSDSVIDKKGLDLYPTPHQTLPPLYAENEYKWIDDKYDDESRVDMGGYANKGYSRDAMYDIDSDEDVIAPTPRDRYTTDV